MPRNIISEIVVNGNTYQLEVSDAMTNFATIEPDVTSASKAYSVGDHVVVNNTYYKVIDDISIGNAFIVDINIEVAKTGDEITQLNRNLTEKVNGFNDSTYSAVTGLAYDSTNKKLGLKVGADTVIPFSANGAIYIGQYNANTSVNVASIGAKSVNQFLLVPITNSSCSCATGYVMGNDVANGASSYINGGLSYNTSTGVLTITVPRLSMSQSSSNGSGGNSRTAYGSANITCKVYYVGDIQSN